MLFAQWVIIVWLAIKLIIVLAAQGDVLKRSTCDGYDVLFVFIDFAIILMAGGFTHLFGWPN